MTTEHRQTEILQGQQELHCRSSYFLLCPSDDKLCSMPLGGFTSAAGMQASYIQKQNAVGDGRATLAWTDFPSGLFTGDKWTASVVTCCKERLVPDLQNIVAQLQEATL